MSGDGNGNAARFGVYLAELVLATSYGGPNAATGGTEIGGTFSNPDQAFDGDTGNYASSSSDYSNWIGYDFGASPKDIVEAGILIRPGNSAPSAYSMWHSDDGLDWKLQRAWFTLTIEAGTMMRFDLAAAGAAPFIALPAWGFRRNQSDVPQHQRPTIADQGTPLAVYRNMTRPRVRTPYSGEGRIAGSTTVLGQPTPRKVQLYEQKSGLMVAEVFTKADGQYEFESLREGTYTVVGVDVSGEQNSVIFAHVVAV